MNAAQGFILGAFGMICGVFVYHQIDKRLNYLERQPSSNIGVASAPQLEDYRKKWARELAEDLREQGLVIAEAS